MEHLEINHDDMISAEVEMVLAGPRHGQYRVIVRDLDSDAESLVDDRVLEVRYYPRPDRDAAIAFAKSAVHGSKVAA
jgi:hypothetical protein